MRIPKFWIKKRVNKSVKGKSFEVICSGWSFNDAAEADRKALEVADNVFRALAEGREGKDGKEYDLYHDRPIKEEIVGEYSSDGLAVVVTRTSYGSLVLNADQVMFIDVDEPSWPAPGILDGLKALFGKKKVDPRAAWVAAAQESIRAVCTAKSLSLRLYRTRRGLRGLITDRLFRATDPAALALLREFKSDELYVRLCKSQDCFRARLTPKPRRCGTENPPQAFPFEDAATEKRQRAWEARYGISSKGYATCAFLGAYGAGAVLPAVDKVVKLHDGMTRIADSLPLA